MYILDSASEDGGIVLNLTESPEVNEINDEIIPPSASEANEGNKLCSREALARVGDDR